MSVYIVLILEDAENKYHHLFYSTDAVEDFLTLNNLDDYEYKNINFYIDGVINYYVSKKFKDRYIKKLV